MTTYLKVSDKIETLSKGEIQAVYVRPLLPILLIIFGTPLVWIGGNDFAFHLSRSFIITIPGVLLIISGLIILLRKRTYFILKKYGKQIKPKRVPLHPDKREEAINLIHNNELKELLTLKTNINSPLLLELWYAKGHNQVYSQLYYYNDAALRPISLVHVHSFSELPENMQQEGTYRKSK